jgi:serine/threonine-protein kinase
MVAVARAEDAVTVAEDDATRPHEPRSRRASAPIVNGERYELGPTIGKGGMGEVVAAHDAQIGRDVAIKRLLAPRPTLAQLSRFLREARIQGRLEHPAIPPVHELGEDDHGRPYFVMKRLAGVTLDKVLRDPKTPHTRQSLLRAFVEVCRAVELAHSRGVVHRDLKPANVLLGDHEVYVLDWGIARELDVAEPVPAAILGTPGYMAPEQSGGDLTLDGRADVYSLGCILHEILTGVALNPRRAPSRPPRDDVPPELAFICRRAVESTREARIGSAGELADAVQRYLDGDRDVALRRDLAREHLAAAHAAFAGDGDEEARRRTAMREAGRALALDPSLVGAAELVGRLMLSPPKTPPVAVVHELAAIDAATDRRHIRVIASISMVYLLTIPVFYLLGIRDVAYMTAYAVASGVNTACQIGAIYSERFKRTGWPLAMASGVALMALIARMFSPLLIAPGLVAVTMMSFAMSSLARDRRVVVAAASLAVSIVLAVWGAEAVGLLSPTMWRTGTMLVFHSPLDGIESFPVIPGLIVSFILLVACAASIANVVSRNQYRAREQLQVQAWQLRQLL